VILEISSTKSAFVMSLSQFKYTSREALAGACTLRRAHDLD
jgi:hypothetical protein